MTDVTSSIFDSITVTGSPAAGSQPPAPALPAVKSGSGDVTVVSDTGLVAGVTPEEFERALATTPGAVVLRKPQPADPKKRQPGSWRFVASVQGIILVAVSDHRLTFGPGVLEIGCLGILHQGKPFGRDEVIL